MVALVFQKPVPFGMEGFLAARAGTLNDPSAVPRSTLTCFFGALNSYPNGMHCRSP